MDPAISNQDEIERRRNPRTHYKFSPDEMRVMKECNLESFWKRCIPFGTTLGVATYYAVNTGYLKGNPRFGATPKVVISVIVGYFLGKFSYQYKCAEKLMQLPNSQIGELLRQRKKGLFKESLDTGFGPGMSLAPFSSATETYTDVGPLNSLDIDTTRPDYGGLDDHFRPSVDNPIYEEEMPPIQKQTTSYDELRKKNREEYQQQRTGSYRSQDNRPSNQVPAPSVQKPEADTESHPIRTNKYGDALI